MDKYNDLIKKIDFADECNKEVAGNFGRTMTITMAEAFLCKQLLEEKVVNKNCNLQNVSQRSELLRDYEDWKQDNEHHNYEPVEKTIERFLSRNCG